LTLKTTTGGLLAVLGTALLLAPATTAAAAAPAAVTNLQPTQVGPAMGALANTTGYVLAPAKDLRLDPFAQSKADPLDNTVAVQPDNPGMRPVSSSALTGALSNGGGAKNLPVAGQLLSALPG
jgi:hypothetical protein